VIYSGESIHKHEYFPEFASKNKNLFGIRVRVLLGAYLYRKTYLKNLVTMSLLTFGGKSIAKVSEACRNVECVILIGRDISCPLLNFHRVASSGGKHITHYRNENQRLKRRRVKKGVNCLFFRGSTDVFFFYFCLD